VLYDTSLLNISNHHNLHFNLYSPSYPLSSLSLQSVIEICLGRLTVSLHGPNAVDRSTHQPSNALPYTPANAPAAVSKGNNIVKSISNFFSQPEKNKNDNKSNGTDNNMKWNAPTDRVSMSAKVNANLITEDEVQQLVLSR
jgi:hypothetical protein